ncbi:hypothetical protein GCM10010964_18040 [Caldovatus sediminis]|uniref:Class I SAM-dependent methyltransferase n=1 Tax=Caldovatus sediminis TaxID=2041189 RepID=A0A8J2ZAU7_9PROT|nr:class I SAM-dependent methyltransferase [Caldovatus sediminis]GGG30502.1 hypothetical protein GCM10010964_18040 [Caldovatus sediminis]
MQADHPPAAPGDTPSAAAAPPEPAPAAPGRDPRLFAPPLGGESYLQVLTRLHSVLQPRTYLEIGVRTGASLALAACPSIGVDPAMEPSAAALGRKPALFLFQMPSDRFFQQHDPCALLGGPLDMAFLDGLHEFETLLRDFLNTERHCRPNSVIVLHDCLPTDAGMTRRAQSGPRGPTRDPNVWTGDVWKLVPILRRHRPELRLHLLNARPTGLVLITGLDPGSTVLSRRYHEIVEEFAPLDIAEIGVTAHLASLPVRDTRAYRAPQDLRRHFWL